MSSPWMKWYPSDWRADPKLRMCSLSARGLWADMLALMHEAEPYGHLLVGDRAPSDKQIAALVGSSPKEVTSAIEELEDAGVFSRTGEGVIYSRRMVRDKEKADRDRENGKGGGNPKLRKKDNEGVNPPDKAQKPEARSQEKKEPPNGGSKEARGSRLPDDWAPSAALRQWCGDEGYSDEDVQAELDRFRDYWPAQPGAKGRKADWDATFRNWMRNSGRPRKTAAHLALSGSAATTASQLTDAQKLERENWIRGVRGEPPLRPDGTIDFDAPPVKERPAFMRAQAEALQMPPIPAALDRRKAHA